jgi:fatty-acyl-CoA synthase
VEFVTDMAAKRAELTPQRVAFRDVERGTALTYAEVNAEANRVEEAAVAAPAVQQQEGLSGARLAHVEGAGAHALRPRSRPTNPVGKK